MPDNLPTIWQAEPHTFEKHKILETYLRAWAPILSRHLQKSRSRKKYLLFVDGFAGPGIYKEGQDGSPILALNAILEHTFNFPIPIRFVFIEKDKERYRCLSERIKGMKEIIADSERIDKVKVIEAECEERINNYIDQCEERNIHIGPAFFFMDQFGYSQVSMQLIKRLMSNKMCEVFSYFHWDGLNRFLETEEIRDTIDEVYGGNEWQEVFKLDYKVRSSFIERYKMALREKADVKYVLSFAMKDKKGKLISWLFFSTNNIKGLIKMKEAMWKAGSEGGFYFSDKDDPGQLIMYSSYDEDLLTRDLFSKFNGQVVKLSQIEEFVLTETPSYKFRKLLGRIEKDGRIVVVDPPQNRRKGSFKDANLLVKFLF